jgi:hypothetical protein
MSKVHQRSLNLLWCVIPVPKLAKCTDRSSNLLIVSYESQIYLNNLLNLLRPRNPCSNAVEPSLGAAAACPPRVLLGGPSRHCRDDPAPPCHTAAGNDPAPPHHGAAAGWPAAMFTVVSRQWPVSLCDRPVASCSAADGEGVELAIAEPQIVIPLPVSRIWDRRPAA